MLEEEFEHLIATRLNAPDRPADMILGIKGHIKSRVCALCTPIKFVTFDDFRDDLSRKEYTISGMCQQCQDKVFDDQD